MATSRALLAASIALLAVTCVSADNWLICNRKFGAAYTPPALSQVVTGGPIGVGQKYYTTAPTYVNAPQNDGVTNHDHLDAGNIYNRCMITKVEAGGMLTLQCNHEFVMANNTGTVSAQSVGTPSLSGVTYYATITGGTGAYRGASGEIAVTPNSAFNAVLLSFVFKNKPECI